MWIYFVVILLSSIFIYLEQRSVKIKIKTKSREYELIGIFGWLGIILPSIIAGARDYSVGSDTSGYGIGVFEIAKNNSFFDFFNAKNIYVKNVEPLYRVFVYVIAKIFGNVFWQFFFIEFIICYFIYKSLRNLKDRYAWVGYYIFLTFFFPFTLNLMRQSISIAIILYGFKYVRERKIKQYTLVIIIASFIQMMSVVGLLIYPLYYICTGRVRTKTKNINKLFNKHRKLVDGLLVLASCFIIILMPKLITIFSVLKDSYGYQLVHMNKTYNPSITVFILMTLTVMPFILQYRRDVKLDRDYNFYTMVLIMSTILWQVTGVSQESYRVILPLWGILMIAVPKLITVSKYTIVIFGYYVVLGILYFIILFVRLGVNNIYPYASRILGV